MEVGLGIKENRNTLKPLLGKKVKCLLSNQATSSCGQTKKYNAATKEIQSFKNSKYQSFTFIKKSFSSQTDRIWEGEAARSTHSQRTQMKKIVEKNKKQGKYPIGPRKAF